MRHFASLIFSFAFLFLAADSTRAQLKMPLADYSGKMKVSVTCDDGKTTNFKSKGAFSINSQAGFTVQGTAEFVGKKGGVECTMNLALIGGVNSFGRWVGTYTSTTTCSDGSMTQGSGDFDAKYIPGTLSMILEGQDDMCTVTASFKGKGSPGTALCASLSYLTTSKLYKKVFGAWAKSVKKAHIDSSTAKLASSITKAQAGFVKGIEKAEKKSSKAGGTCSKGLTPPASVTAKIQADVLTPMMAGFAKNQPLDRSTRAKITKYQSQYLVSMLKAEATYTLKLNPLVRADMLEKARDKFVQRSIDLLVKATDKGLVWTGPSPQGMAINIENHVAFVVGFFE